jgi:hypothetical protein
MNIRLLVIGLFLFSNCFLFSQENDQTNKFYKRYQGNIGENINVTANIVRLYDNVSGNYVYYFVDENNEMYYGKTIELSGDINKQDSIKLKEFGSEEYTFIGLLEDDHYSGNWNAAEGKLVDFKMEEYYPNGSLPFDIFYLQSEEKLDQSNANSPVAEIELTLIYPSGKYFQTGIVDSVKRIVSNSFFGKGLQFVQPSIMLENFEKEYFDNYNKQAKGWYETGGASFNWDKMINMSVIYNSNYLLCTEYLKYAFAGGAHGMSNLSYDIVNLDNGTKLFYEDVFVENADSLLTVILTHQLRIDYQIPEEVNLKEAGFFVEEVKPNKNVFVNANGIGFVYNSYEIAPYSSGATKILLDFDNIKHLVKPGTPVFRMSQR